MEDFTLTMNCGYPSQDVIVGGDSCLMDEIFCTDLTSFVKEEVILEDTGSTSSSDVDVPSPISESEEIVNIKDETDEEDLESFSFNLETGDRKTPQTIKNHHQKSKPTVYLRHRGWQNGGMF